MMDKEQAMRALIISLNEKLNEGYNRDTLKWIIGQEAIACLRQYAPVVERHTLPPMILGIDFEVVPGQDIELVEKSLTELKG
jgi:hypothetical protein